MTTTLRIFLILLALLSGPHAYAQAAVDPAYQEEAGKARALLQKAIDFYQEQDDRALAVFSRQGEFVDGRYMCMSSTPRASCWPAAAHR